MNRVIGSCCRLCGSRRAVPGVGSCWDGLRWRSDSAAVLGPGSRRRTHSIRCAHFVQTTAASQLLKRAARADPEPVLLAAPEIAPAGHRPPRAEPFSLFAAKTRAGAAKVRSGRSEGASEALRRTGLVARARSAPRRLTCRRLFERRERSERSEFGDGPRDRAPEGSRSASGDRRSEALRPARTRLCRSTVARKPRAMQHTVESVR